MTVPKRPRRPDGPTSESNPESGTPPIGDLLSRSLELGYRALDDYVQHGQRIVQRVGEGASSSEVLATDVQDLGARMMRHASDMLGTWLDLLGAPGGGRDSHGHPASPVTRSRGEHAPAPAADAKPERFRLRVASHRPVEAVLELRNAPLPASIAARELRATDALAVALTITSSAVGGDGAVALDVIVPDDHPAGTYDVLLLDATDETPLGALRLIVR